MWLHRLVCTLCDSPRRCCSSAPGEGWVRLGVENARCILLLGALVKPLADRTPACGYDQMGGGVLTWIRPIGPSSGDPLTLDAIVLARCTRPHSLPVAVVALPLPCGTEGSRAFCWCLLRCRDWSSDVWGRGGAASLGATEH